MWEPLIYSQLFRRAGDNVGLAIGILSWRLVSQEHRAPGLVAGTWWVAVGGQFYRNEP